MIDVQKGQDLRACFEIRLQRSSIRNALFRALSKQKLAHARTIGASISNAQPPLHRMMTSPSPRGAISAFALATGLCTIPVMASAGEPSLAYSGDLINSAEPEMLAVAQQAQGQNSTEPDGSDMPPESEEDPELQPEQLLRKYEAGGLSANSYAQDPIVGQPRIFQDLRSLQDMITDTQRPTLNAVYRRSTQSDDVDIDQAELSQDIFFSQGRSQLRVGALVTDYDPSVGKTLHDYSFGATGRHRFNDNLTFSGEFWLKNIRYDGRKRTIGTYDAYLTIQPSDQIRIYIDTNRKTFDNIRSLQLGITARSVGASIDYLPSTQVRLTLRNDFAFYSDHNKWRSTEGEAVWRVDNAPIIDLGLRVKNFHFTRLLNNGYFNPEDYYSGEVIGRLKTALSKKLTVELAASGGIEHSNPGGSRPVVKSSLQTVYKLNDRWSLDGELSYFSSRQSNSSGFARTSMFIGLHYRF